MATPNCNIHFWHITDGAYKGAVDVAWRVTSLCFAPDGQYLVALCVDSGCGRLLLLDVKTKAVLATALPSVGSMTAAFSPRGDLVAVAGLKRIQLLRVSELLSQSRRDTKGI